MKKTMEKIDKGLSVPDKTIAAVCGLYCGACSFFIATAEDPERLKNLAARFQLSEESIRCHGCRSDKRWLHCKNCKMSACAAERGVDFCIQCKEYPCEELKKFQAAMPHRIELWDDLQRIKTVGCEKWLSEVRKNYTCPHCRTINSAYDIKCRKCGDEPSCEYVRLHKDEIMRHLAKY